MGMVTENHVSGATGVGVYCGDHSECMIERNVVSGTRSDGTGDRSRTGIGIVSNYYALAELDKNVLVGNGRRTAAFSNSRFEPVP